MVMVQQLQVQPRQQQPQQQQQQQQKSSGSVDARSQNGGSLKKRGAGDRGGKDDVWPSQNNDLKVKRPMLGGRRIVGGPSTPVPRWKLYENPFYDGIAAAAAAAAAAQQQQPHPQGAQGGGVGGARGVAVSARKLAATLWELQEFPFSLAAATTHVASGKASSCPCIRHRTYSSSSSSSTAGTTAKGGKKTKHCVDIAKTSMISVQSPNKEWETEKMSQSTSASSRQVAAMRSHVHRLLERRDDARLTRLGTVPGNSDPYMALNRIQDAPEHRSTAIPSSVVAALRIELECTRARAHELEMAHKSSRREVENLLKKVTEEKLSWRSKEEENVRNAVQAVKLEAEDEKRARRRIESVNRKMSRELIDANIAVAKAVQELERERKARELMEDVCDELAREIGEDKAEVEELKRETARVREEVEEERQMLQMAEVWREERVQMKLGEARLEIEEKAASLDSLRIQVEAFLGSRKSGSHDTEEEDEVSSRGALEEAENLANALNSLKVMDVPQDPCKSPSQDGELSDPYCADRTSSPVSHPERRRSWGWGVQSPDFYAGSSHRLETREEVLERLRIKYDQNGPRNSISRLSHDTDAGTGRTEDERGEGSECNSPSEHQEDDMKEEEGSQWESASEDGALDALQRSDSNALTSWSDPRVGGESKGRSESDGPALASSSMSDSTSSARVYPSARGSPPETPPVDDLWRVDSPLTGQDAQEKQLHQEILAGETAKFLLGRGATDLSRNSLTKSITDQGTASPSRDWRSPDRGNPHIARGIKGFIEWPKIPRENGVKSRVLENRVDKVERRMLKQAS